MILHVGRFQIENLVSLNVPFLFLRIVEDVHEEPALLKSTYCHSDEVENLLKEMDIQLDFPVILLCSDGESSMNLAKRLQQADYINVCVVENGVNGWL